MLKEKSALLNKTILLVPLPIASTGYSVLEAKTIVAMGPFCHSANHPSMTVANSHRQQLQSQNTTPWARQDLKWN